MQRLFCDACLKEAKPGKSFTNFTYLCHIAMPNLGGYVDEDRNSVSGRPVTKDLCNKCYNTVMLKAFQTFKEIQVQNGI